MNKRKLIITDIDGTLFDTAEVNYQAYKDVCERNEFLLDKAFYMTEMFGKHYKDFFQLMFPDRDSSFYEELHEQKKRVYADYLPWASVNHHLALMIQTMSAEYSIAIVSTACRRNTMEILEYFHMKDWFDLILTQEDVEKVKPDPEGFLKAMDYLQVAPKDALIFEDSDVGIEAAIKSGANVMRIERGFVS